ncbi:DUF3467 domain-containing protein [bacterium]|nr:DUF3467 domain-containing protein [bacterium]
MTATPSEDPNALNIQVEIEDAIAQGVYSNLFLVGFTSEDVTLDFAYLQHTSAKARIRSRLVLSPRNAKRLARLLTASVIDYESKHGSITDESGPSISLNYN